MGDIADKMSSIDLLVGAATMSEKKSSRNVFGEADSSSGREKKFTLSWMRGRDYERKRKLVARYGSPSCIRMNGCVVDKELENSADPSHLLVKHDVATLVRDFLRSNKKNISLWKSELERDGVVIIPGVFHSESVQQDVDGLLQLFRSSHREFRNNPKRSFWVNIKNAQFAVPSSDLRYQTKLGAYWWLKKNHPAMLRLKLKIDLYMASLVEALGIAGSHGQHEIGRFGSTILLSAPGCAEQIPHTDYCSDYLNDMEDKSPGYFLMFGGKSGMFLNVWKRTHLCSLVEFPDKLQEHIGKTFKKEMLYVPPYGILVCRGDLVHSGTAHPKEQNISSVRYHLQFDRYLLPVDDVFELREEFIQNIEGDIAIKSSKAAEKRSYKQGGRSRKKKQKRS